MSSPVIPTDQLRLRDPFVIPLPQRQEYLLYGSNGLPGWAGDTCGFDCYRSTDLLQWTGPTPALRPDRTFWGTTDFWAPEVHRWAGCWWLLGSVLAAGRHRGTHAFVADEPDGPFRPVGEDPLTPRDWDCLDGTVHCEDGVLWMVFCHEWVQIGDGAMYAVRLRPDLTGCVGEPVLLFRASDAAWSREVVWNPYRGRITDGPCLHRLASGRLIMLWSSAGPHGYALGVARSSGGILGPWFQEADPLIGDDGGHGMLFRTFAGELMLSIHMPNRDPAERPCFLRVSEGEHGLHLLVPERPQSV